MGLKLEGTIMGEFTRGGTSSKGVAWERRVVQVLAQGPERTELYEVEDRIKGRAWKQGQGVCLAVYPRVYSGRNGAAVQWVMADAQVAVDSPAKVRAV